MPLSLKRPRRKGEGGVSVLISAFLFSVLSVFTVMTVVTTSAAAQNEAGQVTGRVTDANGAAIVGASVSVKSIDTGIERGAASDSEGFYTVTSLQPGIYEVTTQASGFAQRVQRVRVTVGSARRLDTELTVTPVTGQETIVEGSGGIDVNTRNAQLSDPISGRQIRELPTITRNPYDLVTLSGNVTPVETRGQGGQREPAYAINGQRPTANNVQLDGGENIVNYTAPLGQNIPLEGVQEIQVITNGFLPEYGRAGGGIISVATRQGSNDFHGSLYEFHRNRKLSANGYENNALGIGRGHLVANQFGYSIGGPIKRDRLFFFSSTEANLVRSREDRIALVPTPELIALSSPATATFFGGFPLAAPINGRVFTVNEVLGLIGPVGAGNAFASLPLATPAFGQVFYNVPVDTGAGAPQDTVMTVARLDYTFTDRSLIYGRYAYEDRNFYRGVFSNSPFDDFNTASRSRNHNLLINWTQNIFGDWTSNTKASFNRLNFERSLPFNFGAPRLFATDFARAGIGGFPLALPGDIPFDPSINSLLTGPINYLQLAQDFSGVWSGQQLRFGINYFYTQDNRTAGTFGNSVSILGAGLGAALSNLVTGNVSTFRVAVDPRGFLPGDVVALPLSAPNFNRSISAHDFAVYFGHDWRAGQRVNINWGLRYDFFGVPRARNGAVLRNFFLGEGGDVFTGVSTGALLAAGEGPANGPLYERDWDNIAPRIGVAIDLTGDGKTSLRAGYGITYERMVANPIFSAFQNRSDFAVLSLTSTGVPIALSPNNLGLFAGLTGTVTLPPFAVRGIESNIETPMVHFWDFAIERELGRNTIGSFKYSGAAGRDLLTIYNINRPGSLGAFLSSPDPFARLNPDFGRIDFLTSDGRSNYLALIGEIASSTWRNLGLQMSARYRYARSLDNVSGALGGGLTGLSSNLLTPFDPEFAYGPSDFDVRHRFIGSFNWEVPIDRFAFGSDVGRYVLGGWQLTGIFNLQSGYPFDVFNCAGALTAEAPCPRAVLTGASDGDGQDDPRPDPFVPNRFVYIEPSLTGGALVPGNVFPPFAPGTPGRNFYRGPNFWNIDMGLSKRIAFTEETSLQIRGEFYNVFNQANHFVPRDVDISSTGYVPAFRSGRRHIQLAVKFLF